jgi:serine/threonine protein phosphatase PrpC
LNADISEADYAAESKRGAALISYLGMGNVSLMDLNPNPLQLQDNDVILLCSDGLYKALSDDRIFNIVTNYPGDPEKILRVLQEEAFLASPHSQDNTSIVILIYNNISGGYDL